MSRTEEIKSRFSKSVEQEVEEWNVVPPEEVPTSIVIIVLMGSIVLYFAAHQMLSTGFFTASFGILEMILLYLSMSTWIVTSVLMLAGRKVLSRDVDAYGGFLFTVLGISWLVMVFPFEFALFANVLPEFLRFLVQWITNDVARVLFVLSIIVNLGVGIYSLLLRVEVRKARTLME